MANQTLRCRLGLWVATLLLIAVAGSGSQTYIFNEITPELVTEIFLPMIAVAVVLERALEVLVSSWREPEKQELKERLVQSQQRLSEDTIAPAIRGRQIDLEGGRCQQTTRPIESCDQARRFPTNTAGCM